MHEAMAAVARPRYHQMPDPEETADDSNKSLPPAIRFVDFRGDFDDYFQINVIGPYETEAARNADLRRLWSLPDPRGSAKFYADRLGSVRPDWRVDPARIATLKQHTVNGFLAAWSGDDDYLNAGDSAVPDPYEPHPDQLGLFETPAPAAHEED